MPYCLKHFFHHVNPPATFLDLVSHDLLVMLGMLVGHAGDVEHDAGDVDGLAKNASTSRENAVKYNTLLARQRLNCTPG